MKRGLSLAVSLLLCSGSAVIGGESSLSLARDAGGLVLAWPNSPVNWVLEQSGNLESPVSWASVWPSLYQSNATSRYVLLSVEDSNRFYRLRNAGPPVPGLTGYWPLDEGTGTVAGGAIGSSLTLWITNAAWSSGRIGPGALQFNGGPANAGGSRAWVSNATYNVLPPAGWPFSLAFWFNPDFLTTGWRGIVGNDATGSNGWHVALYTQGPGTNHLVFAGNGATNSLATMGRVLLLPGLWHRLAATYDGLQGSLYLDGTLLTSGSGALPSHTGPIYFGGGIANYDSFLGRLDDIHTYTNCLTAEQLALTGDWRFDEASGDFSADSSVQGHHASLTANTAWAPGYQGSGIELSRAQVIIRNDDYAVLPPSGGSFSISFWLQPHPVPPGPSGLMSIGQSALSGWVLMSEVEASGQAWLHFTSTNNGGTLDLQAPLTPFTRSAPELRKSPGPINGVWTKLDLTYNGGIASLYVNGRQVQTANGAIRGSRSPLVIGAAPSAANFNGVIDELKIYAREREAWEIGPVASAMWETALTNATTNLVLQGSGPSGKPLTYTILPSPIPTNGTLTHLPGATGVAYSASGRKGPDAFAYTVSDGEFTSPPATVVMSVVQPHWLSPGGGSMAPLDGSSPEHAWTATPAAALDAIWKTNNYYDCFFYAPGEYQTTGWKYGERSTANPGCKHIGSGPDGPAPTVLKLVDIWASWNEEMMFATLHAIELVDNFEVHQMELDCNAANVPKYAVGEPVWLQIPLAGTSRLDTVTLRWADQTIPHAIPWRIARASKYSLSTQLSATNTYLTNYSDLTTTGQVDVLPVGAPADQLTLQLTRRAPGADFYGLAEIEVSGAAVSLPTATVLAGGVSQLDAQHPILAAVDGDLATSWASGPESQVQVVFPFAPGTGISQINLHWNCQTLVGTGRLGPAANYLVRARDPTTGLPFDVPFTSHGRMASGLETITLGSTQATNTIFTDQVVLMLTSKEAGVDFYSLREVTLQNGPWPAPMRLPTAMNTFFGLTSYGILQAFDGDTNTTWASATQGAVGGIGVTGNNLKFTHLKIIGFGTKAGRESFPMFILVHARNPGDPPSVFSNTLIEDCVFTDPATNNADGLSTLTLGLTPPDRVNNAIIRRCTVSGVRPYFSYSHGITGLHMENCLVQDCQVGVYFEPDPANIDSAGPFLIRSNQFVDVDYGVFLSSHPGARFDSITMVGNETVLSGGGGWGWLACDVCLPGPSGVITNVTALNNIVRYADWSPRPGSPDGGLYYSDIRHAMFGNNVIAIGTSNGLRVRQCPAGIIPPPPPPEDCDHPGPFPPGITSYPPCLDALLPGHLRAWFNNRDLSGTLLPVLFSDQGVDGLASQQQWPE